MIGVATPAIVMREIMRAFQTVGLDGLTTTYTHDLDELLNTAATAAQNTSQIPTVNTLAWSRTVLAKNDLLNQRVGRMNSPTTPVGTEDIQQFNGRFTVEWRYYATNIHDIEAFEVLFGTENGIRNIAMLELSFGNLGVMPYVLDWSDLDSLVISPSPNYMKYVSGSFDVSGSFMVGTGNAKTFIKDQITSVNTDVKAPLLDAVQSNIIFYK